MNILFLTISQVISDISERGIYPDLLRKFAREGHEVYIVCPFERKHGKKTCISSVGNVHILGVKTLNITKSNIFEKGLGTILIEYQYKKAIKRYLPDISFNLVLYSTPPITFNNVILKIKNKTNSGSYLLLKDIFPQNAVDLGLFSKLNPLYHYFRKKERFLYTISDNIGCMSKANVNYLLKNNSFISGECVEVCPNCIEVRQRDSLIPKENVLAKFNIPTNAMIFAFTGNIGKPQGIDFLIDVLDSNKYNHEVFFVVAGEGTEYKKLEKWFNLTKPSNSKLIPNLNRNECDLLVSACDVGLIFLDCRFTIPNYPSRLLTYLENKIPVLMATDTATDIGKIAEDNGFGIWVGSGDLKAFNTKLDYLLRSRDILPAMGDRGYNYLLDNYTVDKAYNIIMSHYR